MARKHIYYAYIMASPSRTLYIGVTNDIERRVRQHKNGTFGGFTSHYRCYRLVWFQRFSWIDLAIAREKELKGWLRARKIALIEQENPTWIDLSEEWGKPIHYDPENQKQILRDAQDDKPIVETLLPQQQSLCRNRSSRFTVALNESRCHARITLGRLKFSRHTS